jgi:WD40 repeat protein
MIRVTTLLFLIAVSAQAQSFTKDVAPIFAKNCSGCHAASVKMGSLDLETWEGIQTGGNHGTILVPGKSGESRLYTMLTGESKPLMPMGGPKLAEGEIEAVRKWIDSGAKPPAPGEEPVKSAEAAPSIKPKAALKPQIFALDYRPDGKLIAAGGYKEVRLLDPANGKALATLSGHVETVRSVAFSKDGKLLAAAGGLPARKGEVKIWDVDQRSVVKTISGHSDCIYAVAFSPDGKTIATSSYDKLIKLWDVATGNEIRTLKDHIDAVYALAFTPDGKRLASGSADRTVKIWDPATGERLYTFGEPTDGINTIAIDPTGKLIAAAGLDKSIRVWSIGDKSGKLLNTLIAHEDAILKLAWSPDGKTLVSSSADKTIKEFRASDLAEIKTLGGQSDWTYALEFAPDSKTFAAGRFDGTFTIYDTAAPTTEKAE